MTMTARLTPTEALIARMKPYTLGEFTREEAADMLLAALHDYGYVVEERCGATLRDERPGFETTYACRKPLGHGYHHVHWTDDGDDIVWSGPDDGAAVMNGKGD